MQRILTLFIFLIALSYGGGAAISATAQKGTDTDMVPVLTHMMRKGDVIQESDIEWAEISSKRITDKTVLDPGFLIGKTPRRSIPAHKAIKEHSLRKPILVEKGSLITILIKAPNMLVTSRAKALEDGSKGELIRVQNLQSNRSISVTVTGEGQGEVPYSSNTISTAK
ncbi:MAG: flagellar basal body P-ring formation chaperone FlgA [Alphaproteobacteria bacterium]